jgi:hypothetical protein
VNSEADSHEVARPPRTNRGGLAYLLLFLAGAALRAWQLGFFEFKNDQFAAIALGRMVREGQFPLTHGMTSGVGLSNPPLFVWWMGVATAFTADPVALTAIVTAANLLALALAFRFVRRELPGPSALSAAVLLAFCPMGVFLSDVLWAQCLLPPLAMGFHIAMLDFLRQGRTRAFLAMSALAAVAGQFHLSGYFLLPAVAAVAWIRRRHLTPAALAAAVGIVAIMNLPYLHHLLADGELRRFLEAGSRPRAKAAATLVTYVRTPGVEFLGAYFPGDLAAVLGRSLGPVARPVRALGLAIPVFLSAAWAAYAVDRIRSRSWFSEGTPAPGAPLAFQAAGFLGLFCLAGYLLGGVEAPPHYFLILFPGTAILAGHAAGWLWSRAWVRPVLIAALLSTALATVGALRFIHVAGGHPREYGPSYASLLRWRELVRQASPAGVTPDLRVAYPAGSKFDLEAVGFVVVPAGPRAGAASALVSLDVGWDPQAMAYRAAAASAASAGAPLPLRTESGANPAPDAPLSR